MLKPSLDPTGAAELFLAGARDAGVRHICISPGSRSTPLAVAALRTHGITTSVHLDERVGGFVALGRALALGQPVGLICTSGTAGANFLPAISEANMANVPLLIMTADRPPEHLAWGVGQTFEQVGLYHRQGRAEFTMPVGGDGGPDHAHRAGWRAGLTAMERTGPVHVNWPFRLPLVPVADALRIAPKFSGAVPATSAAILSEVEDLTELLAAASSPVIVAGPGSLRTGAGSNVTRDRGDRLVEAAGGLGVPILADVLSGLRSSRHPALVAAPSLVIERAGLDNIGGVDLIIHIGQTPTAKAIRLWWEAQAATHVLLDPADTWNDPSHVTDHRMRSDPVELLELVQMPTTGAEARSAHLQSWIDAGLQASSICQDAISAAPSPNEPAIAAALASFAGTEDAIVASSSMPVRDIDMFAGTPIQATVYANRGINGIDGVIATASGISASQHTSGRTFVLIGDVALLHDVGGVLDAARTETPLVIVVVNNDGGGIFSFLPAKDALDTETYTQLFQTPHGTSFSFLAEHPGISHVHAGDPSEALNAVTESSSSVNIVEFTVDTDARLDLQRDLLTQLRAEHS